MDTEQIFGDIFTMSRLTYRYFNRLKPLQARVLKKRKLQPAVQLMAMRIYFSYNTSLSKAMGIAIDNYQDYLIWVSRNYHKYPIKQVKEAQAYKEFLYQGFKPVSPGKSISEDLKKLKLNPQGTYIISNKILYGHRLILPIEFSVDYSNMCLPNITGQYAYYGVAGHTRIYNKLYYNN